MYCENCGKQILDNSKFCEFCGQATLSMEGKSDKVTPIVSTVHSSNTPTKNDNTVLKVVEIFLWIGVAIVLLNLFNDYIDWWGIVFVETIILSGLGYIKNWHKNFEIPLVLMAIGLIVNLSETVWFDTVLYAAGIYGLIIKKRSTD